MPRLERVLAATDGSAHGEAAVVTGARLSQRAGAALDVLTVIEPLRLPVGYAPPEDLRAPEYRERLRSEARERADAQLRAVDDRPEDAEILVEEGIPAAVIGRTGDERRADLIVVGAHPRPTLQRFLVGSTAERVLRLAHRPMLAAVEPGRVPFERVLAAVDLSAQSARVMRTAAAVCAADGAELRVLYAQEPLPPMLVEAEAFDEAEYTRHGRAELERVLAEAGLPDELRIEPVTHQGHSGPVILEAARNWDADLIVVGTHGLGFIERLLLGSTSLHVLRHAERATIIVPPQPED